MTNRENYKKAFSRIRPSEKSVERMITLTEKRKVKTRYKVLIAVAAMIAIMVCAAFSVNAATDGALFEGLTLMINGEDVNIADYITNYKSYDKDGVHVDEYEFEVPDGDGNTTFGIVKEEDDYINVSYGTSMYVIETDDNCYTITDKSDVSDGSEICDEVRYNVDYTVRFSE